MNLIEIHDFDDPRLDIYTRLTEAQLMNQNETQSSLFVAESPYVVQRALDFGCEPFSFLMQKKHLHGLGLSLIERAGDSIPVFTAELPVLQQLTGFSMTRGILCAMKRPALPSPMEVLARAKRIAVLEKIMNPTNIGAVFRSAAALNMDAVLLTPGCSDPLYRRSARVSMGTVFQVPWTILPYEWPDEGMNYLKQLGFSTAALALSDDSISIADPVLMNENKIALVLGTEGDGLASSTIADCDYTVRIPMSHGVDSLNVAAASAVAFYQVGVLGKKT